VKLRIQNNSIRLRLTQGEVRNLAAGRRIQQTTEFPASSKLITSIEPSTQIDEPSATFIGQYITLKIPTEMIRQWASSDQVGIEANRPLDGGRSLHILIEKDFDCLHARDEDNIDTFPNPQAIA
jgi:hypothetical protein